MNGRIPNAAVLHSKTRRERRKALAKPTASRYHFEAGLDCIIPGSKTDPQGDDAAGVERDCEAGRVTMARGAVAVLNVGCDWGRTA
ncbi:hypothetical protein [Rhizobium sp. Leaf341]|uniref:hypothetical protein n=1 Tax=Rhizobium sp. Leaf341 TaxID=1736344 RepID=UPI000713FCF3|nr:hypothetical protein [Rhizobium sp. Leaf341]KQR75676.1 hypothetical protein ASG03_18510 [Rhizobium sp. Leaf341]